MSLLACRTAIHETLKSEILSAKDVITHGGPITMEELQRIAVRAPALVVGCLGVSRVETQGASAILDGQWAVYVLAKDEIRDRRDAVALMMATEVMAEVALQRWGQKAVSRSSDINGTNLHSKALDSIGLSLWSVRWRQKVEVDKSVLASELDEFKRFYGDYVPGSAGPDTAPIIDNVEVQSED